MTNTTEAWDVMQMGSNARVVRSTNANEYNNRSHWFVFCLKVLHVLIMWIYYYIYSNIYFFLSMYRVAVVKSEKKLNGECAKKFMAN